MMFVLQKWIYNKKSCLRGFRFHVGRYDGYDGCKETHGSGDAVRVSVHIALFFPQSIFFFSPLEKTCCSLALDARQLRLMEPLFLMPCHRAGWHTQRNALIALFCIHELADGQSGSVIDIREGTLCRAQAFLRCLLKNMIVHCDWCTLYCSSQDLCHSNLQDISTHTGPRSSAFCWSWVEMFALTKGNNLCKWVPLDPGLHARTFYIRIFSNSSRYFSYGELKRVCHVRFSKRS